MDGFRIYSERDNRYLTVEEIEAAYLFMKHDGSLIRVEVYQIGDRQPVKHVRTPKDLILLPLLKKKERKDSRR